MRSDSSPLVKAASSSRVVDAGVDFVEQALAQPLVLSTGAITRLTEAQARVVVDTPHGRAQGRGSIYLSDLWAWPDPAWTHEQRDAMLRRLCTDIAARLAGLVGAQPAHPLELGLRLHEAVCGQGRNKLDDSAIPVLARAMCLSPFDAAIHDAVGNALRVCALELYDHGTTVATSGDGWFQSRSAIGAIASMLHRPPRERLPAWLIVGKQDDLERQVRPWFDRRGYRCFKLKLHGRQVSEDVSRTAEMVQAATRWGCQPRLSVDTNEACPDADFVARYLRTLQRDHPDAFACLEYLEQPTGRDIVAHACDWREVARLKPVLLDEGLTALELLPVAARQGWSGLALKTCKGHSFALTAAAWAHERGMLIAMQDLTNPGISAIHSALLAAYLPTINGVELNSPQFTPAANESCRARWPGLFDVRDGYHRLDHVAPTGLGAGASRGGQT